MDYLVVLKQFRSYFSNNRHFFSVLIDFMTTLLFIHFSLSLEHHIKFEMVTFVINRNREHVNSQL